MEKRLAKRTVALTAAFALTISGITVHKAEDAQAASKAPTLSASSISLKKGQTKKIKVNANKQKIKKVTWKVDKTKLKITKKTKKYVVVKALKTGSASISATIVTTKKTYTKKVKAKIKKAAKATAKPKTTKAPSTQAPAESQNPSVSSGPDVSTAPVESSTPDESKAPEESSQPDETGAPVASTAPSSRPIYIPPTISEPTPEESETPEESAEPVESAVPSGDISVSLTAANLYASGCLENSDGTACTPVYGEDGSVTFTSSNQYSGGGMAFYFKNDKSAVDLSKFSGIKVVIEGDSGTSIKLAPYTNATPNDYLNSTVVGADYGLSLTGSSQEYTLDFSSADKWASRGDAYAFLIGYNAYQLGDYTGGEKLYATITVKSVTLIAKEGADAPEESAEPAPEEPGRVSLTAANLYASGCLENEDGTTCTPVYGSDGSVTFTTSNQYSGGGMAFYFKDDKSAVDLSEYSGVKVVLEGTVDRQIVISATNKDEADNGIHTSAVTDTPKYVTPTGSEQEVNIDFAAMTAWGGLTDAYAIVIKYNGYDDGKDNYGDGNKLYTTIKVKSITLIAKEAAEEPEETPEPDEPEVAEAQDMQVSLTSANTSTLITEDRTLTVSDEGVASLSGINSYNDGLAIMVTLPNGVKLQDFANVKLSMSANSEIYGKHIKICVNKDNTSEPNKNDDGSLYQQTQIGILNGQTVKTSATEYEVPLDFSSYTWGDIEGTVCLMIGLDGNNSANVNLSKVSLRTSRTETAITLTEQNTTSLHADSSCTVADGKASLACSTTDDAIVISLPIEAGKKLQDYKEISFTFTSALTGTEYGKDIFVAVNKHKLYEPNKDENGKNYGIGSQTTIAKAGGTTIKSGDNTYKLDFDFSSCGSDITGTIVLMIGMSYNNDHKMNWSVSDVKLLS